MNEYLHLLHQQLDLTDVYKRQERLYDVAFDDTARAYSEFKKAGATTYGSLAGKELLAKLIVSSSDTPFANFLKALGSKASDWVRDGHTHFSGVAGGKCPYCQQKLAEDFENDRAATFDADVYKRQPLSRRIILLLYQIVQERYLIFQIVLYAANFLI